MHRYGEHVRAVRYAIAIGAWLAAAYVSLWFAANTEVGPIIAVLSPTHGVHEGDVVVVLAGAFVASVISFAVLSGSGGRAIPGARRPPADPGRG